MTTADVKLYALSTCSHCKSTKHLLNENEVDYDVVEVDRLEGEERQAMIEEVKQYNPRCTFPTLRIGDQVIVGFREDDIREALNLS
ncbi:MAG: glutaredoxin family protein [Desulfosudaceae bacterium]